MNCHELLRAAVFITKHNRKLTRECKWFSLPKHREPRWGGRVGMVEQGQPQRKGLLSKPILKKWLVMIRITLVVETSMKDLSHTEKKVVLVNPFSQQLSTQVLPPTSHPPFLEPSYTFVVVLGNSREEH